MNQLLMQLLMSLLMVLQSPQIPDSTKLEIYEQAFLLIQSYMQESQPEVRPEETTVHTPDIGGASTDTEAQPEPVIETPRPGEPAPVYEKPAASA